MKVGNKDDTTKTKAMPKYKVTCKPFRIQKKRGRRICGKFVDCLLLLNPISLVAWRYVDCKRKENRIVFHFRRQLTFHLLRALSLEFMDVLTKCILSTMVCIRFALGCFVICKMSTKTFCSTLVWKTKLAN